MKILCHSHSNQIPRESSPLGRKKNGRPWTFRFGTAAEANPGRGHPWRRRRTTGAAFTLIEILVVVVILGILAATILPQFIGTTHDAKVGTAKSNIAQLESAIERFYVHMDRYPSNEEGLKILVEPPAGDEQKWRGPYIKMLRPDPWGRPFQYRHPGSRRAGSYDLWSQGPDGADGGEGEAADIGNWL